MKFPIIFLALFVAGSQPVKADLLGWLATVSNWNDFETGIEKYLPSNLTNPAANATADAIKANTVRFLLYTNNASRFSPDILVFNDTASLKASRFNSSNPVKFFIHGFGHNGNCTFPQDIKDVYLANGYNLNIISVDWGSLSENFDISLSDLPAALKSLPGYYVAVKNTAIVGKRLGQMIKFLIDSGVTTISKVHVVGWSLGGQVAGYAGNYVSLNMPKKIPHITGLDPAGPLYQTGLIGRHLNKADADFVDFTHTDMGQSGTAQSLGHVNFFANSGFAPQPTCISHYLNNTSPTDFLGKIPYAITGSCSHDTAPDYYQESILTKIQAKFCNTYTQFTLGACSMNPKAAMGDQIDPSMKQGFYYVALKPIPSSGLYSC